MPGAGRQRCTLPDPCWRGFLPSPPTIQTDNHFRKIKMSNKWALNKVSSTSRNRGVSQAGFDFWKCLSQCFQEAMTPPQPTLGDTHIPSFLTAKMWGLDVFGLPSDSILMKAVPSPSKWSPASLYKTTNNHLKTGLLHFRDKMTAKLQVIRVSLAQVADSRKTELGNRLL